MAGKNTTISNVQPAAGNLRVQTSVYGSAIALVYGTARISGNLLWYGGFAAIPHTSTSSGGGKGGGSVRQDTTNYTYQAAVMMALGEGPMNTVLSAWKGKTRYSGAAASMVPATRTETFTVPVGGLVTVSGSGAVFLNNVQVTNTASDSWDTTRGGGD